MTDRPSPLTPADCDLRDFPHTPMFRARLFGSSFHAQATDAEWRAGVTLWLKSWDQVPAGSLPDNDVELCRLAELARDLKTWKKLKDGAMRGWIACSDGRLYHPVVAEGVNTAIEAKLKQRLKTAKARIAALEKHLAAASTDDDKARITDEIRKLQQTLSQGLSQTLSQRPREGEGNEKEKGLNKDSVPNGTDAAGASSGMTDPERRKAEAWQGIKSLLNEHGMPKAQTGTFVGKLVKDFGEDVALTAMEAAIVNRPGDPDAWLVATCQHAAGQRTRAEPGWRAEQRQRTQQAAPGVAAQKPADQYFIEVEARSVPAIALD